MSEETEHAAIEALIGVPVAEVERNLIIATLKETGGNRTHAAKTLRISLRTLRNKIAAYVADGHDVPEPGAVH